MSVTLTLTAGTLPQGFCPTTEQARINQYAASLSIILPDYYGQFVTSSSTPGAADQNKVWLKLDGDGDPIGFFLFVSGAWTQIAPPNVWVGTLGGVADAYTLSVSNYASTTGPRTNDVFIVRIPAASANTGACTLNLNALGVESIKVGGSDPWAGALEALKWYTLVFDGTNYEATEIKQLTVAALPAGTNGDFLRTRGGASTFESPYTSSETSIPSAGNSATFPHNFNSIPISVNVRLRCTDAGGDLNYAQNEEVSVESAYAANASNEDPAFAVRINSTAVYAVRNSDVASIILPNSSTGSPGVAITENKWKLVCYAIR